jgi:hypothetical protein
MALEGATEMAARAETARPTKTRTKVYGILALFAAICATGMTNKNAVRTSSIV